MPHSKGVIDAWRERQTTEAKDRAYAACAIISCLLMRLPGSDYSK